MKNENLIYDFIDGQLPSDKSETLFETLYYDEESRKSFTQSVQMLLNINQQNQPIPVPVDLTASIFNQVGIPIPKRRFAAVLGEFFKSRAVRFATGLVAAILLLLTGFYSANILNHNSSGDSSQDLRADGLRTSDVPQVAVIENKSNSDNSSKFNSQSIANNNLSSSNFAYSSGFALYSSNILSNHLHLINLSQFALLQNQIMMYYDNLYRNHINRLLAANSLQNSSIKNIGQSDNRNIALQNNDNATNEPSNDLKQIDFSENGGLTNSRNHNSERKSLINNSSNNLSNNLSNTPQNKIPFTIAQEPPAKNYRAELLFSKLTGTSTAPIAGTNTLYTFDLSANYFVNKNSAFGFTLGSDNFPQEFSRLISGKKYIQIQNPQLYYLGLNYSYKFSNWFSQSYLLPYVDIMAGATKIGPILRAQLGINIPIFARFQANVGIGNSLILYNVENVIYTSNKFNFIYGVSFKI